MGPSNKYFLFTWSEKNAEKIEHRITWEPGSSEVIETVWTVPQVKFTPGTNAFIIGLLRKDSVIEQTTDVILCMGVPFESK